MSTSIVVQPSTDLMPLVEQIRARTEQLFSEFLVDHGIAPHVEVDAHNWTTDKSTSETPELRWQVGVNLNMNYWLNGTAVGSSFPVCWERHVVREVDVKSFSGEEPTYPPELLGKLGPIEWEDCSVDVSQLECDRCETQKHYWSHERNAGSGLFASTGHGFVMAATAEDT